jgi:1-acyl-sn-glycerol-3-phosphate acyltransferase
MKMKSQYFAFAVVVTLVNLFSFYYTIVFCAVYTASSINWLGSVVQGIILDWFCFGIIGPAISFFIRIRVRNNPKLG